MRAKSNQIREGNGGRFQGRRKGKEKSFWFVVVKSALMFQLLFFSSFFLYFFQLLSLGSQLNFPVTDDYGILT